MRSALLMGIFLVCGMALPAFALATPDLSVSVTASPDPAVPSDDVTVRVTARNNGDSAAAGATIGIVGIGDARLVDAEQCVNFGGVLSVCDVGTIAAGATLKRTFTLTDLEPGPLTAQASVSYQGADARPADNLANASITVEPRADLKLDLTAVTRSYAENTVSVVAAVRNPTEGPARESKLELMVPRDLTVASAPQDCSSASASATAATAKLTCDLGTMDAKSSQKRTIKLQAKRDLTVSLVGSVSWSRRDPTPEDNQAQTLVTTQLPARNVRLSTLATGVPKVCYRHGRIRLKLRTSRASRMTSASVLVRGKRVRKLTGKALRRTVTLRGLPRTDFTLRITAQMRNSGRLTGARSLRACLGLR